MTKNITKIVQKAIVCLLAVFFAIAKCNAQTIVVQPVGTNVLNGGTAVFIAAADSGLLAFDKLSLTWYYSSNKVNRVVATNSNISIVTEITNSLLGVILGGDEKFSVLTIKNVNPTNQGNYYVVASEPGLLGIGVSTAQSTSVPLTVSFPPPVITISNSVNAMTTAGFHLQMSTPATSNVVVEASSDMKTWTPIYTNLNSTGSLSFMDTDATNHPARYYRAHTQ